MASRSRCVAATMRTSTSISRGRADAREALASRARAAARPARPAKLADLVEEHGAAVALLEDALLDRVGARERALLVAEQRALDQVGGQRRAVDDHHALVRARARAVHVARDDLLAGAGLAEDQHGHVVGRDAIGERVERAASTGAWTTGAPSSPVATPRACCTGSLLGGRARGRVRFADQRARRLGGVRKDRDTAVQRAALAEPREPPRHPLGRGAVGLGHQHEHAVWAVHRDAHRPAAARRAPGRPAAHVALVGRDSPPSCSSQRSGANTATTEKVWPKVRARTTSSSSRLASWS